MRKGTVWAIVVPLVGGVLLAVSVLGKPGSRSSPAVRAVDRLQEGNAEVRGTVMGVEPVTSDPKEQQTAWRDREERIRRMARERYAEAGSVEVVRRIFLEKGDDRDATVQYVKLLALQALGEIGSGSAMDVLYEIATDRSVDSYLRSKAAWLLARRSDSPETSNLVRLLVNMETDSALVLSTLNGLRENSGSEARGLLDELRLYHWNEEVRRAAYEVATESDDD